MIIFPLQPIKPGSTRELFSQYLNGKRLSTILHLGDVFDRRKYSNYNSLHLAKEMFFEPAKDYDVHMLVGNHDAYYKNTNDINSVSLTLGEYENIRIYPKSSRSSHT